MLADLRYALRNLLKNRGFTAVAAATLAIGIGANTAIFSIIDTILLRPLPYRNPDRLVRLFETEAAPGHYPFAGPDFLDWKARNHTFEDMALYSWPGDRNVSEGGRPDHVIGVPTEANFFSLLSAAPLLGRTWIAGEDQPGKDRVVVLSYSLWRSRFAGDPGVIGRTVKLDSRAYTIVGVMPAGFRYPMPRVQLWTPLNMDAKSLHPRGNHWVNAIGRMKPGVSLAAARADLQAIAAQLEKTYPDSNRKVGAAVVSLHDDLVGDSRGALLTLLGAVGVVLLIACANVANLLLSRAIRRQREMAVRTALGAGRTRLVRQLLTESLALSFLGGALGLLLAWVLVELFTRAKSFALPQFSTIQLNGEVLVFAFLVAAVTGILFGVMPAWQTSRPDLHDELKGGAGSSVSPSRQRRMAGNALVVGEIGLSLVLLISAALLLDDFARLRDKNIGVEPRGVWTATVRLPAAEYESEVQQYGFAERLLEKCRQTPGVESAAISDHLPLEGGSNGYITLPGQAAEASSQLVEQHTVMADYFHAMGIRLLEGHGFTPADVQQTRDMSARLRQLIKDGADLPPDEWAKIIFPVVINQSMTRHFWPHEDPLGRMFAWGSGHGPWSRVVGVVNDVPEWGLTEKTIPEAYSAFTGDSRLYVILHSAKATTDLTAQVRRALGEMDSSLPLFSVRTMNEVIADHTQGQQFLSLLVGSFAAFAALLAAIGIYGVLSYAVTQRTREIGIRMSLGASRGQVLAEVMREGMLLVALGLGCGLAGAVGAGRIMAAMLHEVKPFEPSVFAAATGLLAVIALLACAVPARRAARLDPTTALRYE